MESPHEKFVRISPLRVKNVTGAMRSLGGLTHPYNYDASEEEWAKIIDRLRADLRELEDAARAQVQAAERRAQRARKEEGVEDRSGGFRVDRSTPSEEPWSAR